MQYVKRIKLGLVAQGVSVLKSILMTGQERLADPFRYSTVFELFYSNKSFNQLS